MMRMLRWPPYATLVDTSKEVAISHAWLHPGSQENATSGIQ